MSASGGECPLLAYDERTAPYAFRTAKAPPPTLEAGTRRPSLRLGTCFWPRRRSIQCREGAHFAFRRGPGRARRSSRGALAACCALGWSHPRRDRSGASRRERRRHRASSRELDAERRRSEPAGRPCRGRGGAGLRRSARVDPGLGPGSRPTGRAMPLRAVLHPEGRRDGPRSRAVQGHRSRARGDLRFERRVDGACFVLSLPEDSA